MHRTTGKNGGTTLKKSLYSVTPVFCLYQRSHYRIQPNYRRKASNYDNHLENIDSGVDVGSHRRPRECLKRAGQSEALHVATTTERVRGIRRTLVRNVWRLFLSRKFFASGVSLAEGSSTLQRAGQRCPIHDNIYLPRRESQAIPVYPASLTLIADVSGKRTQFCVGGPESKRPGGSMRVILRRQSAYDSISRAMTACFRPPVAFCKAEARY